MRSQYIQEYSGLSPDLKKLINRAMRELKLSLRAYDRILTAARTIADLEEYEIIGELNLLEAIQYRNLDRSLAI